jgi:hypothetical protein
VVVTLLPRELLPGVLEPLARALAARARFSLERCSDVYLVARSVAAHVLSAASSGRVSFALSAGGHQLDLMIGPLGTGTGESFRGRVAAHADELEIEPIEPIEPSELLQVVVRDADRLARPNPR